MPFHTLVRAGLGYTGVHLPSADAIHMVKKQEPKLPLPESGSDATSTPSGYLVLSEDAGTDATCLALFSSSRASAASSRLLAMYTMENRMAEIVKLPDKDATCEIQDM